jgi:hypothetical protein
MAKVPTTRVPITKKDGTRTAYFWLSRGSTDIRKQTIYKKTKDGIKRITGAHFDAVAKEVVKHA